MEVQPDNTLNQSGLDRLKSFRGQNSTLVIGDFGGDNWTLTLTEEIISVTSDSNYLIIHAARKDAYKLYCGLTLADKAVEFISMELAIFHKRSFNSDSGISSN